MLRWAAYVQVSLTGRSLADLFLQTNVLNKICPRIHIIYVYNLKIVVFGRYMYLPFVIQYVLSFHVISLMKCWMHQCRMSSNAPCVYLCNKDVVCFLIHATRYRNKQTLYAICPNRKRPHCIRLVLQHGPQVSQHLTWGIIQIPEVKIRNLSVVL